VIVSGCLLGINCAYDGSGRFDANVVELLDKRTIIPVCPEQLGGLPTPRLPCEIRGGTGEDVLEKKARVVSETGEDVTDNFLRGAKETLKIAERFNCQWAILKRKSPSCSPDGHYDGTFAGEFVEGLGVTAKTLQLQGILLFTSNELQAQDEQTKT